MANDDDEEKSSGGFLDWLFGPNMLGPSDEPKENSLKCENCGAIHSNWYSKNMCSCSRSE